MKLFYCDKWSSIRKKPWNILDESSAKLHHSKRESYTAVYCEGDKPKYIVNLTDSWVSVSFLDELLRKYLHYDFEVQAGDDLFLKTVMFWEYEGETDVETDTLILGYQSNGHIVMEKRNLKTGEVEEREAVDDVAKNWEKYPDFGDYMSLCKEER
ncbi:hypothetical protein JJB07_03835 [Tumebacillus sp. ITR2]|uniref:Uncharacterized protein n=1 Tax=Tumebacillus amylolyticus TaxID=2801339 RepID=A0ABS1J672_9BACL|nr:hypothetical protein [Tumebacillus amylolyticus]MBL0385771.1 hypothetical protein [Tumebacillus amylolyticus]